MKLESILTSLEASKKLQEAGFEADTCFYWVRYKYKRDWIIVTKEDIHNYDGHLPPLRGNPIPAYTFQQLLKILNQITNKAGTGVLYLQYRRLVNKAMRTADVDILAEAVLWAIENNFLETDDEK